MHETISEPLALFEHQLRTGGADSTSAARTTLRLWLLDQLPDIPNGSLLEIVAELSKTGRRLPGAACVLVRALSVPDLVPPGGVGDHGNRSICELIERSIPEIFHYLQINKNTQTFEKRRALETAHDRLCDNLRPMAGTYKGLESMIAARKQIVGGLNHSIVRAYGEAFNLPEVRSIVENVFSRIARVAAEEASLLLDLDDLRSAISEGQRSIRDAGTFIHYDFLSPFLASTDEALQRFIEATRGRFTAAISSGSARSGELQKRYPLHNIEKRIEVRLPFRNSGPGLAIDVRVDVSNGDGDVVIESPQMYIGNILPGEFYVSLDIMLTEQKASTSFIVLAEWGEVGEVARKSELFEFSVLAQRTDIDWEGLQYEHPYSTAPAEGEDFVGRQEIVTRLAGLLLRSPMEPFYITGQKRVGKTSLAIASADFARDRVKSGRIHYKNILWGGISNEDPRKSVENLGWQIEDFISLTLPARLNHGPSDYSGTLSPIVRIADAALQICPDERYVIIIDEFDEIHQELYLSGNLAETFFGNIRAISGLKNIAILLVGGENMPFIMERQGQKLNKFSRFNLSYFSRDAEWDDYLALVRKPTENSIWWHEDAINELFTVTNGNPYFTKKICSTVLTAAVRERDADMTLREIQDAVGLEISNLDTNSFVHLWHDGILKPAAEREPEILKRSRVLVAIARCSREKIALTVDNLIANKGAVNLADYEVLPVLNDFVKREVLSESAGVYTFKLPLFEYWLRDVGIRRLAADSLSEELAQAVEQAEEAARVLSSEVVALSQQWPAYRGRHVGADDIRGWYEQVDGHRNQRLLFKLLQGTRMLSESHVREKLRSAHFIVRRGLPEFVMRKLTDRRGDIILTYVDGEGKSGQYYASTYAEENKISVDSICAADRMSDMLSAKIAEGREVNAIVIVDDIAATGNSLADSVAQFVTKHLDELQAHNIIVFVVAVLATAAADRRIRGQLGQIDGVRCDFRAGEILDAKAFAFDPDNPMWENHDEMELAKSLCRDLGSKIYKRNPLGFGNQGLLIVFPNTTPNNTLPILHTAGRSSSGAKWTPLFPRVVN